MLKLARSSKPKKKSKSNTGGSVILPKQIPLGSALQYESSSDEDDKIWDDRWVRDENEEEERRKWEEQRRKQQSDKHHKTRAKGRKPGGSAKSDDESSSYSSTRMSQVAIRKKHRKRADSSRPLARSPSGDNLTNSEEIKTSEEEEDPPEIYKRSSESSALNLLTARSLASDVFASVTRPTRSMSLVEPPIRDWKSDTQLLETVRIASQPIVRSQSTDRVVAIKEEDTTGAEVGADEVAADEALHWARLEEQTAGVRMRARSVDGGYPSAFSPIQTKRRRALTPQRAARPVVKTPTITIAGDAPPSGGGSGEEECLEWKPLWKAN